MMGLGSRIRDARKEAGLTQAELAKKVHLSRSHIGAIELDRYNPSLSTLTAIAAAVGRPIAGLMDSNGMFEVYNPDNSVDVYETDGHTEGYYHDPETALLAQEAHDNPDLRILFDASRKLSPKDLQTVTNLVKSLTGEE